MIPFLTYPLALIAMAALPALAAIYLLRNRFRKRQVSSLMLWRFRTQSKEGGARVQRLQLPLIFFLELLALALLVTAAAGPHLKLAQSTRPLVIVLDDSFSMRAGADGTSSQQRAKEYMRGLFRFQAPPSSRLILAGAQPQLTGAAARNWSELEKMLEAWSCQAPSAAIEQAITLASEIGRNEANILVLADHPPAELKIANARLQWRSFGSAMANFALVNASRSAHGEEDRCLLEVANFASTQRSARLTVQSSSNSVQQTVMNLGPREQQRLVFNLPKSENILHVQLEPDALEADNFVQLVPPQRRKVRVRVAVTNSELSELIDRTLAATGLRASISENPDLVIHHSEHSPGTNSWSLNLHCGPEPKAYTGPFVIDGTHPLAEGIGLAGVIWAAAAGTNGPDEVPVIMAGNLPLLTAREDLTGRRFLTLNFNPELSSLQRSPDWPVLIWNLLDWRIRQMPGLSENNVRLGADVVLRTAADSVFVRRPDGTERTYTHVQRQLALETPLAGLYTVAQGTSTNSFAVNALAPEESDLQQAATGEWGAWKEDVTRRYEQSPLAWLIGLGALGLLALHLCLLAQGRGGN